MLATHRGTPWIIRSPEIFRPRASVKLGCSGPAAQLLLAAATMDGKTSCRLPNNVVPVKYSLVYRDLDLDRCTFSGSVLIHCKVRFWCCESFA